jgi:hypothetical protein
MTDEIKQSMIDSWTTIDPFTELCDGAVLTRACYAGNQDMVEMIFQLTREKLGWGGVVRMLAISNELGLKWSTLYGYPDLVKFLMLTANGDIDGVAGLDCDEPNAQSTYIWSTLPTVIHWGFLHDDKVADTDQHILPILYTILDKYGIQYTKYVPPPEVIDKFVGGDGGMRNDDGFGILAAASDLLGNADWLFVIIRTLGECAWCKQVKDEAVVEEVEEVEDGPKPPPMPPMPPRMK